MNKNQTTIVLIVLTMLTLSAGFAAGMLTRRVSGTGGGSMTGQSPSDASLVEQLQLSPSQQDQMREIWEAVRTDVQNSYRDAQDLQRLRDQAVAEILTDEQKSQFEKITEDFAGRFTSLSKKREQTFTRAVERTKRLLNESQRTQYELILKDRLHAADATSTLGMAQ